MVFDEEGIGLFSSMEYVNELRIGFEISLAILLLKNNILCMYGGVSFLMFIFFR